MIEGVIIRVLLFQMEVDGAEDDMERNPSQEPRQTDSDLERLNLAVGFLVQVLEEELPIVEAEQLSKSLGVVSEVASRQKGGRDTRDTAWPTRR